MGITGHDAPHPEALPHDHGFWQGTVCPVCTEVARRQGIPRHHEWYPGAGVIPEFPGRREPTPRDRADPRFEVLWTLVRTLDVQFSDGTRAGANGNDVCAILDALDQAGAIERDAVQAARAAEFKRREQQCLEYAKQHRIEGNEASGRFHEGAAMAFKDMAEAPAVQGGATEPIRVPWVYWSLGEPTVLPDETVLRPILYRARGVVVAQQVGWVRPEDAERLRALLTRENTRLHGEAVYRDAHLTAPWPEG